MASLMFDSQKNGWRVQVSLPGRRRCRLWLGQVKQSQAQQIGAHLDSLKRTRTLGLDPEPPVVRWLDHLDGRYKEILIKADLIDAASNSDVPRSLKAFAEWYLASKKQLAPSTRRKFEDIIKRLTKHFGPGMRLDAITAGAAERWEELLYEEFAESHAGKILSRSKQIFAAAVKEKVLAVNPFDDCRISTRIDTSRQKHIKADVIQKVIDKTADPHWKCLIAMARFQGIRVPTDALALQWSDVNWELRRITIRSQKTKNYESGVRICPIFPEVLPLLEQLFHMAPDGETKVFWTIRSANSAYYGKRLKALCERAGVTPWVKPFVNLRLSCRTDLERRFPNHVLNKWLGHSGRVAEKHYLPVTDEDFATANGLDTMGRLVGRTE